MRSLLALHGKFETLAKGSQDILTFYLLSLKGTASFIITFAASLSEQRYCDGRCHAVCVSVRRAATAQRRISLRGEGNASYPSAL